jgi:hypothetical protein
MNIVFVSSEVAPWAKTGGLGDVAGSLPPAFAARGECRLPFRSPTRRGHAAADDYPSDDDGTMLPWSRPSAHYVA